MIAGTGGTIPVRPVHGVVVGNGLPVLRTHFVDYAGPPLDGGGE